MLFFFFLIPPPPISTLFPYTTLFRSSGRGARAARRALPPGVPQDRHQPAPGASLERRHARAAAVPWPDGRAQDRKSTRLNSSHRCISYAVFCLKKKKKKKSKKAKEAD